MNIRSLGYQTDLAFLAFEGRVEDRGDHYFAQTPDNPGYFWGNLLVMKSLPKAGDLDRWLELFKNAFAHQPLVKHTTFGLDSTDGQTGELEPFLHAGFALEQAEVLTAETGDLQKPKYFNGAIDVRALKTDEEWRAAIENQVRTRKSDFKEEMYLPFKRKQMAKYRRMSEAGLGNWFGAFLNGQLVGDCGLFHFNDVGRYQSVGTHPDFRKQGICATLIHQTATRAIESKLCNKLVMVAETEEGAARVYKSTGFKEREKHVGIYRWPKAEWQHDGCGHSH